MDQFTYYTIPELKQYAREQNIPIGGLTRKADILDAIQRTGTISSPTGTTPPTRTISPTGTIPALGDLFTEFSKHLTVEELKNLCKTNKDYRALCSSEQFQKLVREKYVQEEKPYRDKINELLNISPYGFTYPINKGHDISYNNIPSDISLWETIRDDNGDRAKNHSQISILRKLFGVAPERQNMYLPDYKIDNVTPEQVNKVLNFLVHLPDFDMNKVSYPE